MSSTKKNVTVASTLTVVFGIILLLAGYSSPILFVISVLMIIGAIAFFLFYITTQVANWADDVISGNTTEIEWSEPIEEQDEDET